MFEWFRVRNFRNFNDLKIDQLGRINVIGGRNNSGKTSLLELLFLLASGGNPTVAKNANVVRSSNTGSVSSSWNPWAELFHDWDTQSTIEISAQHRVLREMYLRISVVPSQIVEAATLTTNERRHELALQEVFVDWMLKLSYTNDSGEQTEYRIAMTRQATIEDPSPDNPPVKAVILLPKFHGNSDVQRLDVQRLAVLRNEKRDNVVLDALKIIEPRLQNIEESSITGTPAIVGDIGLSQLVPLNVMGGGMTNLARLVLAMSSAKDGVVLVDEIENGFHHSVLHDVWRVIERAADQFDVQVFATTHSYECVTAAQEALKTDHLRYLRLDVVDSNVRCVTYPPESIEAAIRHDLEVR